VIFFLLFLLVQLAAVCVVDHYQPSFCAGRRHLCVVDLRRIPERARVRRIHQSVRRCGSQWNCACLVYSQTSRRWPRRARWHRRCLSDAIATCPHDGAHWTIGAHSSRAGPWRGVGGDAAVSHRCHRWLGHLDVAHAAGAAQHIPLVRTETKEEHYMIRLLTKQLMLSELVTHDAEEDSPEKRNRWSLRVPRLLHSRDVQSCRTQGWR
jgi:hypothetical protein